jgi:hypothetical protein
VVNQQKSVKRFVVPLLLGVGLAAVVVGVWLYSLISEVGLQGVLPGGNAKTADYHVHLKEQRVYKVKKKQQLLGINVIRIISRQQPEEFLVLDGVSRKLVDKMYGKKPDLVWANLMANQFLKLRQPGDGDTSPVSVEVQNIRTLSSGVIQQEDQKFPYWQLEVQFKLSNESEPRYYEAGVIRHVHDEMAHSDEGEEALDTLVVGYAQREAFQKELLADLMNHLSFERN